MPLIILILVFILSISLTQFSILSPLSLFHRLNIPGFIFWAGAFILFAWMFGDDDTSFR